MTETKKAVTTPTTDVKLASIVAKDVELDAVLLRSAKVDSSVGDDIRPAKLETRHHFRARYEMVNPARLHVLVEFHIELLPPEATSKLVSIDSEYLLVYRLPEDKSYPSEALRYFAELNGVVHLWPYWRELVHTIVARVGLGSLTLPVYRVKPKTIVTEPETAVEDIAVK